MHQPVKEAFLVKSQGSKRAGLSLHCLGNILRIEFYLKKRGPRQCKEPAAGGSTGSVTTQQAADGPC